MHNSMLRQMALLALLVTMTTGCIQGCTAGPGSNDAGSGCNASALLGRICQGGTMGVCAASQSTWQCVNNRLECTGVIKPNTQPEVCDLGFQDENCNGVANEGCVCRVGESRPCSKTLGECREGTQLCVATGSGSMWDATCTNGVLARDEVPNGKDDDCDGDADEDFECSPGERGPCGTDKGICEKGERVCKSDGTWDECQGGVEADTDEDTTCDGRDADCDGVGDLDESHGLCACLNGRTEPCGPDTEQGACQKGQRTCVNGSWGLCQGAIYPEQEICDGIDQNCNGRDDLQDGCQCINGRKRNCGPTTDLGLCEYGEQECTDGVWGRCEGAVFQMPEACDGVDNDCDGVIDDGVKNACDRCGALPVEVCNGIDDNCNGFVDEGLNQSCACVPGQQYACGKQVGECTFGVQACQPNGLLGPCTGKQPQAETCDGVKDEDCDGVPDASEDVCECIIGTERPCPGGTDEGECNRGKQKCQPNGKWGECEGRKNPLAAEFVCDGKDEDCDGVIDDGVLNLCGTCGRAPLEVCNNVDDDCDGLVDEGLGASCACVPGTQVDCGFTRGTCTTGKQTCQANGQYGTCTGVQPQAELCDGMLDTDCDGVADVDEPNCECIIGAVEACGVSSRGECRMGERTCGLNARWGVCVGNVDPAAETCDGKDNDCDGATDENVLNACGACGVVPAEVCNGRDDDCDGVVDDGLTGCTCVPGTVVACGKQVGTCTLGTQTCQGTNPATAVWGPCTGGVQPQAELCDGIEDTDCDGVADAQESHCACINNSVQPCGTNTGSCTQGSRICANGQWGACLGETGPQPESCNGADDDCDGEVDDRVKNTCGTCGAVPAEACGNGSDDDCDGSVDENCPNACLSGQTMACSNNVGACRAGLQRCVNGAWAACDGIVPTTELCGDGVDNDCNGRTDEGCVTSGSSGGTSSGGTSSGGTSSGGTSSGGVVGGGGDASAVLVQCVHAPTSSNPNAVNVTITATPSGATVPPRLFSSMNSSQLSSCTWVQFQPNGTTCGAGGLGCNKGWCDFGAATTVAAGANLGATIAIQAVLSDNTVVQSGNGFTVSTVAAPGVNMVGLCSVVREGSVDKLLIRSTLP